VDYFSAVQDFSRARRQAAREQFLARLQGRSVDLLSYEEVRQKLKARDSQGLGLKEIPLDAIVGSVGRYTDFTRSFLPLVDKNQERWARIQTKFNGLEGLPPIEVYQVGDVYFVRDGNHRVSVARQMGATHIEAYVTKIEIKVPLTPGVQPDDLILKAEYAEFLEQTGLDKVRPGVDLSVTAPGKYPVLLEHINVHRYFMGIEQQREIAYEEAVGHWYDATYLPVIEVVREQGILAEFPGRTETDLYLWVSEHRAELEDSLGWEIETRAAAADLVEQFSARPERRFTRVAGRLLDALTPDSLEGGPSPGTWRRKRHALQRDTFAFSDILVPISGRESGWPAVAQAVEIAHRESARLLGLYVVGSAGERESERVQVIQAEFARRCEALGVQGRLAIETGSVTRTIRERSRWADLVVLELAHPPEPQPVSRLSSGFGTLIRRCSTPVLAVPWAFSPMGHPLLAYDGSSKAKEALYLATYLAARGQVPLTVVTVLEGKPVIPGALAEAQAYLDLRGVQAKYLQESGPVAKTILQVADEHDSDLLLMGGYGHSPVVEVMLGSTVDSVLRASRQPVLICC
jgi:nucleotide-binding universal stress UspA family protein